MNTTISQKLAALRAQLNEYAVEESNQSGFKDVGDLRYALQTLCYSEKLIRQALDRAEEDLMNLEDAGPAAATALKQDISGYKALLGFLSKHERFCADE